ncbi:MAG: hypothetical protein IT445_20430 [Phycisphaeraceae bacterium]|nr:hypothetical protein [Phycisphaeraceae bacterium]
MHGQSSRIPDFGVMLNEDGDVVISGSLAPDPSRIAAKLRANLDTLLDTPVRTLVFNVATGSDVMLYPTEVGSRWDWRVTEKEESPPWDQWLPTLRAASEAGFDAVRAAGDWAHEHDLLFVPSYRINDAHFAADPQQSPLTGRYWLEHPGDTLGVSPLPEIDSYKNLLNFEHHTVRAYRLGILREIVQRYGDVMDGLQIDGTRHPYLFPPGKAAENGHLLTEMLAKLRSALDEAGQKHGKYIALLVRVPTTLANCHWAGYEVERWIEQGIVDVVMPSPSMTLSHDTPLHEFTALTRGRDVRIGASVLDRTQLAWPMLEAATAADFSGSVGRDASTEQIRGAIDNARAMGATMIEFYNFNLPLSNASCQAIAAALNAESSNRIYAITPAYYLDHTDTYENRKQIPAELHAGQPMTQTLYVAHPAESDKGETSALRLGFHGISTDTPISMNVTVNGCELRNGPLGPDLIPVTGRAAVPSRMHPPLVSAYLVLPLDKSSPMRAGENVLALTFSAVDTRAILRLVEVQLAVWTAHDESTDTKASRNP